MESKLITTRRQLLRGAGGLITIIVGGMQISCSAEETALIDATQLSDHQLLTLARILQQILPHEDLDAAVFRDAVAAFADRIAGDDRKHRLIADGVAELDATSTWLDQSRDEQLRALKGIGDGEFFALLRTTALEQVYRDERTWALVGYEGDASRFGGYLDRGFNDIDWLPPAQKEN